MHSNRRFTVIAVTAALALSGVAVGCGGSGSGSTSSTATTGSTATAGSGDGTASNVLPVSSNPISNNSTQAGLKVTKALVENNVDPDTGKPVDDHLELQLMNSSGSPMKNLEVYYSVTDKSKGVSEGYFTKLTGFVVDAGSSAVVHFDNTGTAGHYPINEFGLYATDKNALVVAGEASARSFKPAAFSVNKDSGGAEAGVE